MFENASVDFERHRKIYNNNKKHSENIQQQSLLYRLTKSLI